ncbi:dihydrolipoamide acetyltransferase family protein [Streptomyces thermolineatus]|uniref:dihydrolipoamide acetyltransferase family protein n=2 Tax=Streptomyces TaxID=1883 RepID=UPI0031D9D587
MPEFTMPALGADMEEGTLLEWLVHPGDQVHRGEVVAVIETAKSTVEIESFDEGTVERLLVEPGTRVPVGAPLAVIAPGAAAGAPAEPPRPAGPARAAEPAHAAEPARGAGPAEQQERRGPSGPAAEPAGPAAAQAEPAGRPLPAGRPAAAGPAVPAAELPEPASGPAHAPAPGAGTTFSPLVRRLAEQERVDLSAVRGTGRGGKVTRSDVRHAARTGTRPRVTPFARRLAAELGVDPAGVRGTGPDGAVRADDVRRAAARTSADRHARPVSALAEAPAPAPEAPAAVPEAPAAVPPAAERPGAVAGGEQEAGPEAPPVAAPAAPAADRQAALRRAIGTLMSRSKHEIPHYYLSTTVDLAAAVAWMRDHNRACPVAERLVPAALLLKAAALGAREVPEVNGFWTDDRFVPGGGVHLGVAVSLRGGGLLAPALRDADTLPLPRLMSALRDLVARARTGRLRGSEAGDPTITVTNLGDQGVEAVFGVIYPPQVALVGFGRVTERPVAVDGMLGVRPAVTATLSADHRAGDGAVGARYLSAVDRLLQKPEEL